MEVTFRRVASSDIFDIALLANDEGVARMTAILPYPYTDEICGSTSSGWAPYTICCVSDC